ncbi:tetratricopeptide repeat protein [Leptospira adleri]|uniref:tetratricopeptide repeat protein n=1 Tax=Leptospira adleri TaxID=2023186 RepID=UPI00108419F9|nr:anaphase-promoting complex subunit 5 domain protein [Leptospira adleri]TGM57114.1 anaphase-promoting complex subunit 5 domain protein [Leptospira adleri]
MILKPTLPQENSSSDYYSHFFRFLDQYDYDGASEFLSSIFKNEKSQTKKGSPTDFFYEEDSNSTKSLFAHFQEMNAAFHFSEPLESRIGRILENLEESLTEDNLRKHRFKPFNGFLFKMSDYEFCNAVMDSVHFDLEEGTASSALGLNHEMIWDADSYPPGESSEYYDFIYDLKEGEFPISFQGKKVKGNDLHVHTKLILFSKMISEMVKTLFEEERFAKIPKEFPFYVLIDSQDCYDYKGKPFLLEVLPAIQLQSLEKNPHLAIHQNASQKEDNVSSAEELIFSLAYLENPDQKEYKRLLELVDSHPEWKELLFQGGIFSLQKTETVIGKPEWKRSFLKSEEAPSDLSLSENAASGLQDSDLSAVWKKIQFFPSSYFSSFFWKLAEFKPEVHLQTAKDFQNKVFLNSPKPLEDTYTKALPYIQEFSYTLVDSYLGIPETYREELKPSFEEALVRLERLPHPGFKLRAMEIGTRLSSSDWTSKISPVLQNATEEYINQMIGLIRCMPEEFPWFGDAWDFVFEDRLFPLGRQAKAAVPVLTEVLERYNRDSFNEDVTRNLAPVFYEIGAEDIHPLIHELHKRNQFYMEEFYSKWSKEAPSNRWSRFEEVIENSPESLNESSTWNRFLYDSEPGFQLYYENMENGKVKDSIFRSFLRALKDQPFDLLQRFALFYSENKKKSAKKNEENFFSTVAEVAEILTFLKSQISFTKEQLETWELGCSAKAVEAFAKSKEECEEILNKTLSEFPDNPFLKFLKVKTIENKYGLKSAMEELKTILSDLWKEDYVLNKAFFLFLLKTHKDWSKITSEEIYAFYEKTKALFEKEFYNNGRFAAQLSSFRMNLFSKVLEREYPKLVFSEQEAYLKPKAEEYKTLETLGTLSPEKIVHYLKPGNPSLNFILASKAILNSESLESALLQVLEWETQDAELFPFLKLFYQDSFLKEKLYDHPVFLNHLSYFIENYREISPKELAKIVFNRLREKKNSETIVKTAKTLDNETIINCFLSIHWAFQNENKMNELEELTEQILQKTDLRKPEYVLIAGNLGVLYIQNENLEKAKELFQKLFSMDWSRFDYKKDKSALDMEKIIGPDINEQYADIFRKYFAMAKFNAACLYSRMEDASQAVSYLKEAVSLEPKTYDRKKILAETDFSKIVGDQTYQDFLNSLN